GEWRVWKNLGQELNADPFVRAGRARGGSELFVLKKHVLPHLIPALVVRITEALPFLALGSLILERFFGIPGLGSWIVEAVMEGDPAVLRTSAWFLAMTYLIAQEFCDIAARHFDPRLRTPREAVQ
ncbi:MAG: ABC transporter permease subunit, partial [Planctomycetes bacterium]|nr:ABC transporter permease subunit [Planctomycetota bacterium]